MEQKTILHSLSALPPQPDEETQQTDKIDKRLIALHAAYCHLNNFIINDHGIVKLKFINSWVRIQGFRVINGEEIEASLSYDENIIIRFRHGTAHIEVLPGCTDDDFVL
jgi:hypothetical protein